MGLPDGIGLRCSFIVFRKQAALLIGPVQRCCSAQRFSDGAIDGELGR